MSFQPTQQSNSDTRSNIDWSKVKPKQGSRPARISMIVDLGKQNRDNYEEDYKGTDKQVEAVKNGEAEVRDEGGKEIFSRPQKPAHQVVVFADLTSDICDYGESLGNQPFRLMLNNVFKGIIKGTTFGAVPPKTQGGVWTFHGGSVLTKLARATGTTEIISDGKDNMDVSLLLGKGCMISVDVSETKKGDKTYTNIRYKGCSEAPEMPDGKPYPIAALSREPLCITFDNVTNDTQKFIRRDVKATIMEAENYEGSNMQSVLRSVGFDKSSAAVAPKKVEADKAPTEKVEEAAPAFDEDDEDMIPF